MSYLIWKQKIKQNLQVLADLRLGKCLGLFSRLVEQVIYDHRDEGQLLLSYKTQPAGHRTDIALLAVSFPTDTYARREVYWLPSVSLEKET